MGNAGLLEDNKKMPEKQFASGNSEKGLRPAELTRHFLYVVTYASSLRLRSFFDASSTLVRHFDITSISNRYRGDIEVTF